MQQGWFAGGSSPAALQQGSSSVRPVPSEPEVVYVVDGDRSERVALESLLTSVGHRVRSFETADGFLDCGRPSGPACLLLEVRLKGMSGLDLQQRLGAEAPELALVFLSGHADVPVCARAMKSGAVDFLTKPYGAQAVLDAVRQAMLRSHEYVQASRERRDAVESIALLTKREREVFRLVVQGLSNRQIGNRLGTSEKTVKVHRGRVMHKLDAGSVVDLVHVAGAASGSR